MGETEPSTSYSLVAANSATSLANISCIKEMPRPISARRSARVRRTSSGTSMSQTSCVASIEICYQTNVRQVKVFGSLISLFARSFYGTYLGVSCQRHAARQHPQSSRNTLSQSVNPQATTTKPASSPPAGDTNPQPTGQAEPDTR